MPLPYLCGCTQLRKEDASLRWSRSARELHNQVRAFAGWPGTVGSFSLHDAASGTSGERVCVCEREREQMVADLKRREGLQLQLRLWLCVGGEGSAAWQVRPCLAGELSITECLRMPYHVVPSMLARPSKGPAWLLGCLAAEALEVKVVKTRAAAPAAPSGSQEGQAAVVGEEVRWQDDMMLVPCGASEWLAVTHVRRMPLTRPCKIAPAYCTVLHQPPTTACWASALSCHATP